MVFCLTSNGMKRFPDIDQILLSLSLPHVVARGGCRRLEPVLRRTIPMSGRSLCEGLLQKPVSMRLGCSSGRHGVREVKIHPWFNSINWRRMEAGRDKPPFEPDPHAVYAKVRTFGSTSVLAPWGRGVKLGSPVHHNLGPKTIFSPPSRITIFLGVPMYISI